MLLEFLNLFICESVPEFQASSPYVVPDININDENRLRSQQLLESIVDMSMSKAINDNWLRSLRFGFSKNAATQCFRFA